MANRLRRAFTLTELVVVTTVLLVVSALIIPNMAHMRDNQLARDVVPSIQRLITYAREQAISQRTTAILTFDRSAGTLTVKQDTTVDENAPTVSAISASQGSGSSPLPAASGGPPINVPTAPIVDPSKSTINRTISVPSNLELNDFQLAGKSVSEPDFQLHFYSDGTCDSAGLGYTLGGASQSIVIDDFGRSTLVEGPLPDATTEKWEAGSFEPRADATQ